MSLAEKIRRLKEKLQTSNLQEEEIEELSVLIKDVEASEETPGDDANASSVDEESIVRHPEPLPIPDVVMLEWEEIEPVINIQAHVKSLHEKLGILCINHEENIAQIRTAIIASKKELSEQVLRMRKKNGLPDSVDYILNVPQTIGEKGSFVKRETN
jgi:hypothetical protein